jgi:hypothetical protein
MTLLIIPALAAALAAPPPLTAQQAGQVRCVAALAIVANDQERGAQGWDGIPPLSTRGAHFAGTVGESLMKAGARTREQVRDEMVGAVAALQKKGTAGLTPDTVKSCIALMDKVDPPAPRPKLAECAAMMALAYDDATRRKEIAGSTRDLAMIAAVLDSRARDQLRSEGKTEAEGDVAIGLAREKIEADAKAGKTLPDTAQCIDFAKP